MAETKTQYKYGACIGVAVVGLLLAAKLALAGPSYSRIPITSPPVHGYKEAIQTPIKPESQPVQATKYKITVTIVPEKAPADYSNVAVIVAHVPENAEVWFMDRETSTKGNVRYFVSPSLSSGNYTYSVRINWVEDGKKVTQTHAFRAQPGLVHCIFLTQANSVEANLAKLSPEDRKLANEQKLCAVQNANLLGEMEVPVKTMVNGQPVFLCCKGCEKKAQANPEQTLAKVKELKATNGPK